MLRAAVGFFVLALVALLLGAYSVAGLSMEIARLLVGAFLILALITGIVHLLSGRGP